jgi:hypothetical protein
MRSLPRRALLGARLPSDAEAFSPAGARVASVVPGSMADAAGVAAGDRIARVAGCPVRSLSELAVALRHAGVGRETEIATERGGKHTARMVPVQPYPVEAVPGQQVSYEELAVPRARLRSIVTHPSDRTPRPGVLVLQGIACESVDFGADPGAPLCRLVHGWAEAGLVTMRVDRRGVGDSEGGPCREVDFETELADHRAGLDALLGDARVDPDCVFLFGHSVGGMVATLLAAEHAVRGVVVYGTSPAKWLDCVAESTRRQLALRGVSAGVIEERVAATRARLRVDPPNGRSAEYHRQLDAVDLVAAWRRVRAPVLVLRGEHDWVVGRDEQERIATLAGAGPDAVDVLDLPGLDHLLSRHASIEASIRDYGHGRADSTIVATTVAWLRERSVRSAP